MHWPLAFPEAYAAGGFDLIFGNPPWEQFKGEEQQFFRQHKPAIAAMTSETRNKAIADLAESDPPLFARWKTYQALQGRLAHFAKTCGRYTRTSNETNTYVLFTELAARSSSHVGLIVKSGIATDAAQSPVWRRLLHDSRVRQVIDIVNSNPTGGLTFPAVAPVERFSVLVLGPRSPAMDFEAAMLNFGVEQAASAKLRPWTGSELSTIAPRTRTLLSTSDPAEIELALALHERFGTLDFAAADGANPWGLDYHTLFHSSGAKKAGLFIRDEQLLRYGYQLRQDKIFEHPDGRLALPVYEGQMAIRWDHRARTFDGYTGPNKYRPKPGIPMVTSKQHADPNFEVEPRYWMSSETAEERISQVVGSRALLAMRDVGRPWKDRRVMRAAIFPRLPATHKLPMLSIEPDHLLRAAALLNSMVFDFLVRVHLSGGSLAEWVLDQCAAPPPRCIPAKVAPLAEEMSITSYTVAESTGRPVHRWDPQKRWLLDAMLDALIAHAYGLSLRQYEVVLDHFALLRRMEEREVGEYRSKRLRLEAFEDLQRDA